jgi:glycosyltransferase involved in cell wall biosynthesis
MLRVLQMVIAPQSVDGAPISSTGPERRAANLAARWKDVGVEPAICYPRRGNFWNNFERAGLTLIDFEIGNKFNFNAARQISKIAREQRVDLIHAQGPASLDLLAVMGGRFSGVPVALTRPVMLDDQVMYSSARRRIYRLVDESLTLKLANAVVAVSADGQRRLRTVSRVSADKLHLIHNGVNLGRFEVREPTPADGSDAHPAVTLGMVAQLFPPKAWDDFVRVIGSLRDRGLNVRGMIVGEGELRSELESMVARMGLSDVIEFTGFQHDVRKVLAQFDIFLFTTKREGLSVAVIEAMASGLPVAATDVGGIAEQVEVGENGYIVPAGDVEAMVERCSELIQAPAKRARFSARSRELALERFSEDTMLLQYADLYKELA